MMRANRGDGGGAGGARMLRAGIGAVLLLVALAGFALLARMALDRRPRLTSEEAHTLVTTTLQREAREAFLVTGTLEINAVTRVGTTTRLLPGLLDLQVARAQSTVRAPGRVAYGIDVAQIGSNAIAVHGDTIVIRVPEPRVFSVEPLLERMEVETQSGWLRTRPDAREQLQQEAITMLRAALDAQARRHLADAEQPRINTAETLYELLRPVFIAAGVPDPVFRFDITDRLVYRGGGADRPR
jgi:hypothetical protein